MPRKGRKPYEKRPVSETECIAAGEWSEEGYSCVKYLTTDGAVIIKKPGNISLQEKTERLSRFAGIAGELLYSAEQTSK